MKKALKKIFSRNAINKYHRLNAVLASFFYGNPGKKMRFIGVTGTNGKTTTCHMICSILEAAGRKVGMTSTINYKILNTVVEHNLKMTTFNPWLLQKLLKRMYRAGVQDVVVEVTSIALDQHRLHGINFHTVVFTNLTHDHLDYHKNMENYRKSKEQLFAKHPTLMVVNEDDPAAEEFLKYPSDEKLTYGLTHGSLILARKLYAKPGGTEFVLVFGTRQTSIALPLPGEFNVYNALAAATVGVGLNIDMNEIVQGLRNIAPIPGRMEVLDCGQPFTVIIDYAHTPDALQKVYETIKPTVRGRLISVLGATGRRDTTKRPILGALAGRYADYIIVTNEDPYDEDPEKIIGEVAAGIPRGRPRVGKMRTKTEDTDVPIKYRETGEGISWWRILDRSEAIARAFELARPQDVVVITGKGAEKVMAVGDKLIPYSDKVTASQLLEKYALD